MRKAVLALVVLSACNPPLAPVPDPGLFPQYCYAPTDGGVLALGLTAPVPGCSAPPGPTGVLDLSDLRWALQGVISIPPSAAGTPLPVVVVFHGAGGSGAGVRGQFNLEPAADGGAIFVYLDALQGTWDIGSASPDARRVETLVRRLSASYCIDPANISIAGFSAGAVFTLFLGCNVPTAFRNMVVVAGTDQRFDTSCCTGAISALFIHGTQDSTIPLSQGVSARARTLGRDGCNFTPLTDDAQCLRYACPAPWAVGYCEWSGGHDVPDWVGEESWRFLSRGP